jgi:uncharacterized protein YbbK (DUF523 family)
MIFVSACLVGYNCRYNNKNTLVQELKGLYEQGFLFPICPELMCALGVPRDPVYIDGNRGEDVLTGKARVVSENGADLTRKFIDSAQKCVQLANVFSITKAILKDKSPSCGVSRTYTATGVQPQRGVTAAALHQAGITLYDENSYIKKGML